MLVRQFKGHKPGPGLALWSLLFLLRGLLALLLHGAAPCLNQAEGQLTASLFRHKGGCAGGLHHLSVMTQGVHRFQHVRHTACA